MTFSTRWSRGLPGFLMVFIFLSLTHRLLIQSGVGSEEKPKRGQNRSYSGAEPNGAVTADTGVDLRPVFRELGLSTRAQGARGTCSVFTVTRAIEYALGKQQCRESQLSVEFLNWASNRGLNDEQFTAIKETLRNGWPVCDGFLWPQKAEWTNGVLQMASRDNVRDGHSVLLVGFRNDPRQPGGGVFLIQNTSKGPRDGAMSYEYVRAYMNDAAWIGYDVDGPDD